LSASQLGIKYDIIHRIFNNSVEYYTIELNQRLVAYYVFYTQM